MKQDMVRKTVRIPKEVHARLISRHEESPHISLNALIVEALMKGLKK